MFRHRDDSMAGSLRRIMDEERGTLERLAPNDGGWPASLPRGWSAVEPVGEPVAAFAARCMHDGVDIVIRGVSRSAVWAAAQTYERGLGRRG